MHKICISQKTSGEGGGQARGDGQARVASSPQPFRRQKRKSCFYAGSRRRYCWEQIFHTRPQKLFPYATDGSDLWRLDVRYKVTFRLSPSQSPPPPPPPFLKRLCNHYSNGCCLTQQGWRRLSDELNLRRKSVRPSWRWRRARTAWWDPTCCRRSCQAIAENNQFGGQLKDNSWSASG